MTEKPLPLKAHEVRAVLEGRKTQVRRLIKIRGTHEIDPHRDDDPPWPWVEWDDGSWHPAQSPFGTPGDRVWIRETWALETLPEGERVVWRADRAAAWREEMGAEHFYLDADYQPDWWRSPLHMPRWASRLAPEVVGVRVERIGEADAKAEGLVTDSWVWVVDLKRVEVPCGQ